MAMHIEILQHVQKSHIYIASSVIVEWHLVDKIIASIYSESLVRVFCSSKLHTKHLMLDDKQWAEFGTNQVIDNEAFKSNFKSCTF